MNSGQEIPDELVVSGGNAAEVLEPAKAAIDDISAFVGTFVEAMDDETVGFVGDGGLGAATNDFTAKVVAIIPFVSEEGARRGQMQDDRPADRIARRMDLCRAAFASIRLPGCAAPFFRRIHTDEP